LDRFGRLVGIGIKKGWLVAPGFYTNRQAFGQGKQFAAGRKFDQLIQAGLKEPTGSITCHMQAIVIKNFSRSCGKEQLGQGCRMHCRLAGRS
jgi:hypothetical protein